MSCSLNSHKSCGTTCPATCQDPLISRPCTLACVETCQCDPGLFWTATPVSPYPGVTALTMATITTATRLSGPMSDALICVCATPSHTICIAFWIVVAQMRTGFYKKVWVAVCCSLHRHAHILLIKQKTLTSITMTFMAGVSTSYSMCVWAEARLWCHSGVCTNRWTHRLSTSCLDHCEWAACEDKTAKTLKQ